MEIKFTGATPLEVLAEVAAFSTYCLSDQQVLDRANEIYTAKTEKQPETPNIPPVVTPTPVDSTEKSNADTSTVTPESAPKFVPATAPETTRVPTVEEVRARGIEFAKRHGREKIKAILDTFHVTGMTAIPEPDRAAFLAELDKLEAADA